MAESRITKPDGQRVRYACCERFVLIDVCEVVIGGTHENKHYARKWK